MRFSQQGFVPHPTIVAPSIDHGQSHYSTGGYSHQRIFGSASKKLPPNPCENFLYVFKGARSAPGRGWPPILVGATRRARRLQRGAPPGVSAGARCCKRWPSLRCPIMKPRKIVVKGARYARVASRRPLTTTLVEDSPAPIGGMAASER